MKFAVLFAMTGALSTMVFAQAPPDLSAEVFARIHPDVAKAQRKAALQAKWNVCVDLQMVELEESKALEIIPHLQSADPVEADEACTRIQTMLKAGEAKLVAWPMVRTVDGYRAVSETILEKRTASEFEPPQEPQTFSVHPTPKAGPMNADTVEGFPIAFETRNLGVLLEVEPLVLSDGARVTLSLTSTSTKLLAMQDFGRVLTAHNTLITVPQPVFEMLRSNLNLNLKSGQRRFIAVHRLAKPGNTFELDLVRAVVTKAE